MNTTHPTTPRPHYTTIDQHIGRTPLVQLQRLPQSHPNNNTLLAKLEGTNPAGSVKDRPALSMIQQAEARGHIRPGDTLIEATSGNTGIALAMVAAIRGYHMILIMPDNLSIERRTTMTVYGAQLILTDSAAGQGMEYARELALQMQTQGKGKVLNQFDNPDNPHAHIHSTGPEIWHDTQGQITHFISAMGTTGTITGVATYLKQQNPHIQIIGVQPAEGANIPGIRKWPQEHLPRIYTPHLIDHHINVTQQQAEESARQLARQEGIFAGISTGGALWAALQINQQVQNATIVFIACDRGDRYLSQGVF